MRNIKRFFKENFSYGISPGMDIHLRSLPQIALDTIPRLIDYIFSLKTGYLIRFITDAAFYDPKQPISFRHMIFYAASVLSSWIFRNERSNHFVNEDDHLDTYCTFDATADLDLMLRKRSKLQTFITKQTVSGSRCSYLLPFLIRLLFC